MCLGINAVPLYQIILLQEGAFTEVMTRLKNLRIELKTNAGRDSKMWDWFDLKLGAWGAWLAKL